MEPSRLSNDELSELLFVTVERNDWRSTLREALLLLAWGANINGPLAQCGNARPLHAACALNAVASIEFLIHNGAELDVADDDGNTPLHICAKWEHWLAGKPGFFMKKEVTRVQLILFFCCFFFGQ